MVRSIVGCSRFATGQYIGKVKIISSEQQKSYQRSLYVCWSHADHSLRGVEAQTMVRGKGRRARRGAGGTEKKIEDVAGK